MIVGLCQMGRPGVFHFVFLKRVGLSFGFLFFLGCFASNSIAENATSNESPLPTYEAVSFTRPFAPNAKFKKIFNGSLDGKYEIVLYLEKTGPNLNGRYQYTSQKKDIELKGTIDNEANFKLGEFVNGKQTGMFTGTFLNENEMNGQWHKGENLAKKPLSFFAKCRSCAFQDHERELIDVASRLQYSAFSNNDAGEEVCTDLLYEFRTGKIEFLQPIIRTDNWNNPTLQDFIQQCPNLHLNEVSWYDRAEYKTYAHLAFNLYYLDIHPNQNNGSEYVFHSGGYYNFDHRDHSADHDNYILLDLNNCRVLDFIDVYPAVRYPAMTRTGDTHGLIRSQGNVYVYSMKKFPNDGRLLHISGWKNKETKKPSALCLYK